MSKFVLKAYAFVTQWLPTQSKTLCSHYVIGIDLFIQQFYSQCCCFDCPSWLWRNLLQTLNRRHWLLVSGLSGVQKREEWAKCWSYWDMKHFCFGLKLNSTYLSQFRWDYVNEWITQDVQLYVFFFLWIVCFKSNVYLLLQGIYGNTLLEGVCI